MIDASSLDGMSQVSTVAPSVRKAVQSFRKDYRDSIINIGSWECQIELSLLKRHAAFDP